MKSARRYDMTARAASAALTGERILQAAYALFRRRDVDDLTLQSVAAAAGVTLQTVIRRFGSKDGLLGAVADSVRPQIRSARQVAVAARPRDAVRTLVRSYEEIQEVNWRLLRQADRYPVLRSILRQARALHREWIEETFASSLPAKGRARERQVVLLFAATDFYQWKLLRIDFELPRAEVEALMTRTVLALLNGGRR